MSRSSDVYSRRKKFVEKVSKEHFDRLSRITGEEKGHSKSFSKDTRSWSDRQREDELNAFEADEEYNGYTNTDNPFGDANLLKTFIWTKKYEKMGIKDIDPEEIDRQNRIRRVENKREIEKVKQTRLQKEKEKEARLEEMAKAQREKEALQFKEWEKQEDTFHLKQAKLRSQLRIKEGRAKPIDLLARYIDLIAADDENEEKASVELNFELTEPYLFLNGLRISDLEDLQEDIKIYMELDDKLNMGYWKDLQIIVEDELQKLRKFHADSAVDRREGINAAVSNEVAVIFKDKTLSQLCVLQSSIEKKITSGEEGVDISYWETLLAKLKARIARARLKERHELYLRQRLQQQEQKTNKQRDEQNLPAEVKSEPGCSTQVAKQDEDAPVSSTDTGNAIDSIIQRCIENYTNGRYSPILIPESQLEPGTVVIDPEEDAEKLTNERYKVRCEIRSPEKEAPKETLSIAEAAFQREAMRGMTSDELPFNSEESIKQDKCVASWSDKYRPRKPRYFNRVHTGFEWNKYNQTHYDVDNPPPKIVQGYKFNIFYPDLIDKHKTPTYHLSPCKDNRDFAVIRFSAGPPYEDIAFKIVNREWNYSYKSGFRCQFHNNILQLWFHFKRYRYRR